MGATELLQQAGQVVGLLITGGVVNAIINARSAGKIDQSKILNEIRVSQDAKLEEWRKESREEFEELREDNKKMREDNERMREIQHAQTRRIDTLTLICRRLSRNVVKLFTQARHRLTAHELLVEEIEADCKEIDDQLKEIHFPPTPNAQPPPQLPP